MSVLCSPTESPPRILLDTFRNPGLLDKPFSDIKSAALAFARDRTKYSQGLQSVKLAVLGGFNDHFLIDFLSLCLFRRCIAAEIVSSGYGQFLHEVMVGGSTLQGNPDIVFLFPTHRDLRFFAGLDATREQAKAAARKEAEFWRQVVEKIGRSVVLVSFDQPPHRTLGELSGFSCSALHAHARRTNELLHEDLPPAVSLIDAEALQCRLGALWHDAYVYTLCKQPFAMAALPTIADTMAAAVTAKMGKSRKVLVLDLDNTIWGGVVGDVGMANLELGPETPEGEAFTSFQKYVKALSERGVVLALCSKNDPETAWAAFREHPAMVLRPNDIAAYVINFDDKATNIRSLASTLNLGLDSFVFVDDNPVERAWVHEQLPEVAVVDLPENPAFYADALDRANLFPIAALTREDMTRTQSYRAVAIARDSGRVALDIDAFLSELQPVATLENVGRGSVDRIAQLIGKTNQFKLNPTLFDMTYISENPESVTALRLSDRLQDYGIVSVAVTEPCDGKLEILNWVMSCRVFSRRLEHVMAQILWRKAELLGLAGLSLTFVASGRNGIVPEALESVGFKSLSEGGRYEMNSYRRTVDHHMTIV